MTLLEVIDEFLNELHNDQEARAVNLARGTAARSVGGGFANETFAPSYTLNSDQRQRLKGPQYLAKNKSAERH